MNNHRKDPTRLRRCIKAVMFSVLALILIYYLSFELSFRGRPFGEQRHGNPPLTPVWALECWLWEDDSNTSARVDTLLAGYTKYDIPVRTILIDSPWSLRYNDFIIDTVRYPEPESLFARLQNNGYRVVLWMTSMVNSKSNDTRVMDSESWFDEAAKRGYIAGKGSQIKWWKGKGDLLIIQIGMLLSGGMDYRNRFLILASMGGNWTGLLPFFIQWPDQSLFSVNRRVRGC